MNNFKMIYNGDDFALFPEDFSKNWTVTNGKIEIDFLVSWYCLFDEEGNEQTPAFASITASSKNFDLARIADTKILSCCDSLENSNTTDEQDYLYLMITADDGARLEAVKLVLNKIKFLLSITYLKDMNNEQLTELIYNCSEVEEAARKEAEATSEFDLYEYLDDAKRNFCNYEIGGRGEFFSFSQDAEKTSAIIEYCENLENSFNFFYNCSVFKDFLRIAKRWDYVYYYLWQYDEKNYNRLEKRYLDLLDGVETYIFRTLHDVYFLPYELNDEELTDYLFSYLDDHSDAFIIGEDYSTIYEDIDDAREAA